MFVLAESWTTPLSPEWRRWEERSDWWTCWLEKYQKRRFIVMLHFWMRTFKHLCEGLLSLNRLLTLCSCSASEVHCVFSLNSPWVLFSLVFRFPDVTQHLNISQRNPFVSVESLWSKSAPIFVPTSTCESTLLTNNKLSLPSWALIGWRARESKMDKAIVAY